MSEPAKRQKIGGIPDFGKSVAWSFEDFDEEGGGAEAWSPAGTTKQLSLTLQTLPTPITIAFQSTKFFAPTSVENGNAQTCMFTYTTRTGYVIPFLFWYPTMKNNEKSGVASTFSFYGYIYAKGSESMLAYAPGTLLECADPKMVLEQRSGRVRSVPVAEVAAATVKESETSAVLSQPAVLANYHAFFDTQRFKNMLKHLRKKQDFGGRVGPNIYSNDRSRFLLALGRDMDDEAGPDRCTVVSVESKPTKTSTKTTLTLKYGSETRDIILWPSSAVAFFGSRRVTMRDFKRDMLLFVESSTSQNDKDELYRSFELVGVTMVDATIYPSETHAVVRSVPFLEHLSDITKRLVAEETKGESRRPTPRCDYALTEGGGGRSVPLLSYHSTSALDEILLPCVSLTKVLKRLTEAAVSTKSWHASYLPFVMALTPELVKDTIEKIDTDMTALTTGGGGGGEEDARIEVADHTGAVSGDEDDDALVESETAPAVGPLHRLVETYTVAAQGASGDDKARAVQRLCLATALQFEFPKASDFLWCVARMGVRRRPQEEKGDDEGDDGDCADGAQSDGGGD